MINPVKSFLTHGPRQSLNSRVFQLILLKLFSLCYVFIIICQDCPLGLAVEPISMQMWACELA